MDFFFIEELIFIELPVLAGKAFFPVLFSKSQNENFLCQLGGTIDSKSRDRLKVTNMHTSSSIKCLVPVPVK